LNRPAQRSHHDHPSLPSGKNVVVFVTARNPADETSPTSSIIAIA
jgi:hypothetical protein